MSSTIAKVLLSQSYLCHCIILGLRLTEITIMCVKCMVQVSMKLVFLRCGIISVLDDVINGRDGYKQCDLSKDEILLTIEIICTN